MCRRKRLQSSRRQKRELHIAGSPGPSNFGLRSLDPCLVPKLSEKPGRVPRTLLTAAPYSLQCNSSGPSLSGNQSTLKDSLAPATSLSLDSAPFEPVRHFMWCRRETLCAISPRFSLYLRLSQGLFLFLVGIKTQLRRGLCTGPQSGAAAQPEPPSCN